MTTYFGKIFLRSMEKELSEVINFLEQKKIPYKTKKTTISTILGVTKEEVPKLPLDDEHGDRYFPCKDQMGYSIYDVSDKLNA
jgi:hypothetical protein